MKLITNTIEEAKENAELSIKENFESETIFELNMKDPETDASKDDCVNGSADSAPEDLKKLNGVLEHQNGVLPSGTGAKEGNGIVSVSDCGDISDGELNFILSDEEDNFLTDKENPVDSSLNNLNELEESGEHDVGKALNGCSDPEDSTGNLKDDAAPGEISRRKEEDSSSASDETKIENVRVESEVLVEDISGATENVKEIIEITTTNEGSVVESCPSVKSTKEIAKSLENDNAATDEEGIKDSVPSIKLTNVVDNSVQNDYTETNKDKVEESCSSIKLTNLIDDIVEKKEPSIVTKETVKEYIPPIKVTKPIDNLKENDDGSDAENDREAKEKLLTLLEETPPEFILPEENNGSEKDLESDIEEENKLLSLLEDSQSDSNLNLLNGVIDSSPLNGFESDKKFDALKISSETILKPEKNIKGESVDKFEPLDEKFPISNLKPTANTIEEKNSALGKELIDFEAEIDKECCEKLQQNEHTNHSSEEKIQLTKESSDKPISEMSNDKSCLNSYENVANTSSDDSIRIDNEVDKNKELDLASSLNLDCLSEEEISGDKQAPTKRNPSVIEDTLSAKKLKRSVSCEDKSEKSVRKRSYSVDDKVNGEKVDLKRFRLSVVKDDLEESKKLDLNEKNDETREDMRIDSDINLDENKVDLCESSSKKILSDKSEKNTCPDEEKLVVNSVKSGNVKETVVMSDNVENKDINDDVNNVSSDENSKKIVEKELDVSETNGKVDNSNTSVKDSVCNADTTAHSSTQSSLTNISKDLSLITKIHKDKFKSLTKWDLEELIIQKICESIADRSVIGELRQRVRRLEQAIDNWRKKSALVEKSNREMRTVLNRYLKEVDDNIADKTRPLIPIRITRSVGLQVCSPVSHDRLKGMNRAAQKQQSDNLRILRPAHLVNNINSTNNSNNTVVRRISQVNQNNETSSTSGVVATTKRIVTPTATAPAASISTNNSSSPSSDLEVIDLTEKEEKSIAAARVITSNNLRVVSRPGGANAVGISPATVGQQMIVVPTSAMQAVRGTQRQQLFLTTTTTNGTAQIRPVTSATVVTSRANPSNQTLAIPGAVMMKNGTFVPISPQSAGVVVRSSTPVVQRNVQQIRLASPVTVNAPSQPLSHPAPLPPCPVFPSQVGWLLIPPKPILKVSKTSNGIMLSWSMTLNKNYEEIASYQLYAYQESNNIPPTSALWKKVGDVKALPLPMACTLTQFVEGHKYHFAVRAVDVHSRVGQFSYPSTILLK